MDNSMDGMFRLVREPEAVFQHIRQGKSLRFLSGWLATVSVLCLTVFGFAIGLSHSLWQAFSSAFKMPLLVMGASLLCLPALYLFSRAFGARLGVPQVVTVVLAGVAVTSLLLLGLAPVVAIFVLTSHNYPFFQLLAAGSVTVSGCIGLFYLWYGMERVNIFERASPVLRRVVMGAWFILYAVVGSQMAWRLSPFVGDPTQPFILLQPSRDNLYVDLMRAFGNASGLQLGAWIANPLWVALACLVPPVLLILGAALLGAGREDA
jgi:hypothetical protein